MIDLGTVLPGSTIRIPFATFDKTNGASITMTNFAAADILIYKDGSTTERASTAGFTATTDFDSKTGRHLLVIDLSDNTTADFYAAGSEYLVALDSVTVDSQTVGTWVGRFRIGYRDAILDTTIATLSSQTSFTLTGGPADNNALVGCVCVVHQAASAVQRAIGVVSAYTGSTKTVTLDADPAIFTMAAKDNISFMPPSNEKWINGVSTSPVTTIKAVQGLAVDGVVTTVTNQLTAAQIATGVWQDATSGDFTVASSIGKCLYIANIAPGSANGLATVGASLTIGTNNDKTGYSLSVTPPTAAAIATAVWQDSTAGDFTTASSIGKCLYIANIAPGSANGLATVGASLTVGTNNDKTGYSLSVTPPTAAAVATAVWQDTTAGDFTTAGSIGKGLFTSGAVPGATGGLIIAGSNAATTFATLTVTGATTLAAVGLTTLTASGAVAFQSTLGITGAVTLSSNLSVGGTTTLTGAVTATNASNSITGVGITSNVKKNQALSSFVFLMTDSTTHAPATGLTVAVTRSIDGGVFAAGTLSSVTEISAGNYKVDFGAADMNGNVIVLKATASGADTTEERIVTQP